MFCKTYNISRRWLHIAMYNICILCLGVYTHDHTGMFPTRSMRIYCNAPQTYHETHRNIAHLHDTIRDITNRMHELTDNDSKLKNMCNTAIDSIDAILSDTAHIRTVQRLTRIRQLLESLPRKDHIRLPLQDIRREFHMLCTRSLFTLPDHLEHITRLAYAFANSQLSGYQQYVLLPHILEEYIRSHTDFLRACDTDVDSHDTTSHRSTQIHEKLNQIRFASQCGNQAEIASIIRDIFENEMPSYINKKGRNEDLFMDWCTSVQQRICNNEAPMHWHAIPHQKAGIITSTIDAISSANPNNQLLSSLTTLKEHVYQEDNPLHQKLKDNSIYNSVMSAIPVLSRIEPHFSVLNAATKGIHWWYGTEGSQRSQQEQIAIDQSIAQAIGEYYTLSDNCVHNIYTYYQDRIVPREQHSTDITTILSNIMQEAHNPRTDNDTRQYIKSLYNEIHKMIKCDAIPAVYNLPEQAQEYIRQLYHTSSQQQKSIQDTAPRSDNGATSTHKKQHHNHIDHVLYHIDESFRQIQRGNISDDEYRDQLNSLSKNLCDLENRLHQEKIDNDSFINEIRDLQAQLDRGIQQNNIDRNTLATHYARFEQSCRKALRSIPQHVHDIEDTIQRYAECPHPSPEAQERASSTIKQYKRLCKQIYHNQDLHDNKLWNTIEQLPEHVNAITKQHIDTLHEQLSNRIRIAHSRYAPTWWNYATQFLNGAWNKQQEHDKISIMQSIGEYFYDKDRKHMNSQETQLYNQACTNCYHDIQNIIQSFNDPINRHIHNETARSQARIAPLTRLKADEDHADVDHNVYKVLDTIIHTRKYHTKREELILRAIDNRIRKKQREKESIKNSWLSFIRNTSDHDREIDKLQHRRQKYIDKFQYHNEILQNITNDLNAIDTQYLPINLATHIRVTRNYKPQEQIQNEQLYEDVD